MMWYDDPDAHFALTTWGLYPLEVGRWITDNQLREIADFDGGVVITTRVLPDHPEFDIQTMKLGEDRTLAFLNEALREHLEEMKKRTEDIKARGKDAIVNRGMKS